MGSLNHPLSGMPSSKLNSVFDSIIAKRMASTIQWLSHGFGNELENVQLLIPYRHSQRIYHLSTDLR